MSEPADPNPYLATVKDDQPIAPLNQQTVAVPAATWQPVGAQPNIQPWSVNAAPQVNISFKESGPGYLVRGLWFFFVGWWLGYLTVLFAYFLIGLLVTFPLGMTLLNRIPQVMTLRPRSRQYQSTQQDGIFSIEDRHLAQPFWLWRVFYFLLIGWWLGLLWVNVAYLLGLTLIGLPLAFWMFGRVGAVVSLHRN
jgi:uncharacterized membrane protein YccF (DUF307 family)